MAQPHPTCPEPLAAPHADDHVEGCSEGGGWGVIGTEHSTGTQDQLCDIDVRSAALSADEYLEDYFELSRPVMLRGAV